MEGNIDWSSSLYLYSSHNILILLLVPILQNYFSFFEYKCDWYKRYKHYILQFPFAVTSVTVKSDDVDQNVTFCDKK